MYTSELMEMLRSDPAVRRRLPDDFQMTDHLLESGVLDSFDLINLVAELEPRFDIVLGPEDLTQDNFSTIDNLNRFLIRKKGC